MIRACHIFCWCREGNSNAECTRPCGCAWRWQHEGRCGSPGARRRLREGPPSHYVGSGGQFGTNVSELTAQNWISTLLDPPRLRLPLDSHWLLNLKPSLSPRRDVVNLQQFGLARWFDQCRGIPGEGERRKHKNPNPSFPRTRGGRDERALHKRRQATLQGWPSESPTSAGGRHRRANRGGTRLLSLIRSPGMYGTWDAGPTISMQRSRR